MTITPSSKKPGPAAEAKGAGASSMAAVPSMALGASAPLGAASGASSSAASGASAGGAAMTGLGGGFFRPARQEIMTDRHIRYLEMTEDTDAL
jgi:hypothetical protein